MKNNISIVFLWAEVGGYLEAVLKSLSSQNHHTKTEKFIVVSGKARFGFRNIIDNECVEIFTSGDIPKVVETIPGWAHDITNVGENDLVVILWANELYDPNHPDTIACKV
ncbi:MAG: hypothetical protein HN790_00710 [Methylococcales bacterium]|nr:hypothetical protein [Methylococcales bacterium]